MGIQRLTWAEVIQGALELFAGAARKRHSIGDHLQYNNGRTTARFDVMIYGDEAMCTQCASTHATFEARQPATRAFISGYDEMAAQLGISPWSRRYTRAIQPP